MMEEAVTGPPFGPSAQPAMVVCPAGRPVGLQTMELVAPVASPHSINCPPMDSNVFETPHPGPAAPMAPSNGLVSGLQQEPIIAKALTSPGYVAPLRPFPLMPNPASGIAQQPSSSLPATVVSPVGRPVGRPTTELVASVASPISINRPPMDSNVFATPPGPAAFRAPPNGLVSGPQQEPLIANVITSPGYVAPLHPFPRTPNPESGNAQQPSSLLSATVVSPVGRPFGRPTMKLVAPVASPLSINGPSMDSNAFATPPGPAAPRAPSNGLVSGPQQEPLIASVLTSPGYVAPLHPFPRTPNPASGSAQPPSLPLALRPPPPIPAAALQPPVPGQSIGNRPSFSYNIVSQANVNSATGQQFQPATHVIPASSQSGEIVQPVAAASLQPPVPGQSLPSSSNIPGMVALVSHLPSTDSKGQQLSAFVQSSQHEKQVASEINTSTTLNSADSVAAETCCISAASSSPQSSQSVGPFSSAGMHSASTSSISSSSMPAGSLSVNLMKPSIHGTPVAQGMPVPIPSSSTPINHVPNMCSLSSIHSLPAYHVPPAPIPLPVPQNVHQRYFPPYASLPSMPMPPPAPWLYPPQPAGMQCAPLLPFPGVIPTTRMQSVAVPSSYVHPPGVFPALNHGITSFSCTSAPLPAGNTEHVKQASEHQNDEGNQKNEAAQAWTTHRTETGAIYYYNSLTRESTYEKPHNFMGEPEKAMVQSTPVSWEKLEGTDWTLVTTNDGKKYYYDNKNKASSWLVPPEVADLRRTSHCETPKTDEFPQTSVCNSEDKGTQVSLSTPALHSGGRDATGPRSSGAQISSALDLIKKKLQDSGTPITSSLNGPAASDLNGSKVVDTPMKEPQATNIKDKDKDAIGDDNLSDSSSDSDDLESGPTKDECIIQFKEMLKERGVAPFSKWDKELPKIVFDPRFKAVQGYSTRKALFEQFVRTRAEEVRKEERAAQKAAIDGFKQLLEEASEVIDHRTDYDSFKRKWGNDLRFKALKRKDQELLLNEKVHPLKKAAEEKIQAIQMAAFSTFKSMLKEKGNVTTNSRWSRVKDSFRNDPRYRIVRHEERELAFNEYISELKAAEIELEEAAKAKRDEQEKLKERERETRKRKEREEQEMERIKIKIRRKEAVSSFQALLVETIKDPKASYTESKAKIDKDPQGRATNPDLSPADCEKLFREHVKDLYERFTREFRSLLAEVITPEAASKTTSDGKTPLNSWTEAKLLLKPDPRYSKFPSKDRESLWLRYADELTRKQKTASSSDAARDKPDDDPRSGRAASAADISRSPRKSHARR